MLKGIIKGFIKSIIIMALIGFFMILFISFILSNSNVFGASDMKHIGIEFSESCLTLISLNDTDSCGSPEILQLVYPEVKVKQSYQELFDNAQKQNKEAYQQNNSIQNHLLACLKYGSCNVYDFQPGQKIGYWYNYDKKARDYLSHIIVIQPNILHLSHDFESIILDNGTARNIEFEFNQIAISSCHRITYNPIHILKEFGYILYYLGNNCTSEKYLGPLADPYIHPLEKTPFNPLDSPSYIYREYLESLKSKYKENRLGLD